jgi:pimeloyl-ACP methyl ester carboxylesterase
MNVNGALALVTGANHGNHAATLSILEHMRGSMTRPSLRMFGTILCSVLVSLSALTTSGRASASAGERIRVERLTFPVTLTDGNTYDVVGYLYSKGSYRHRPLQVLVHGLTYTHEYWDMPSFRGVDYSYARYMASKRYAVLALDMLGTGESSRPDGDFVDLAQTADSVHQVIEEMREPGGVFTTPFERIALVGHSNGTITNTFVQSVYGDADALVNTGFAFTPHPIPGDPAEMAALLGTPYVSLPPSVRTSLFYDVPSADPAVVAYDNASLADTCTRGQFLDAFTVSADPSLAGVADVTSPVLIQLGDRDVLHPESYAAADAALFTSAESVTTSVVPFTGHSLNGHYSAMVGWWQIDRWLRRTLDR